MFTFKAQAKSNAKRFLVTTCKIENFQDYLTQHEGQWGTWVEDGQPVPFAYVVGTGAPAGEPGDAAPAEQVETAPVASSTAFGAFAASQLAGHANEVTATAAQVAATAKPSAEEPEDEPAPTARAGATSTTGRKIQKDRPEQNGIKRQSAGSVGDRLWSLFDSIGKDCTLMQAKAMAEAHGLSTTSAAIALYRWRKFNGYTGKAE